MVYLRSNQPAVFLFHTKSAPVISHQPASSNFLSKKSAPAISTNKPNTIVCLNLNPITRLVRRAPRWQRRSRSHALSPHRRSLSSGERNSLKSRLLRRINVFGGHVPERRRGSWYTYAGRACYFVPRQKQCVCILSSLDKERGDKQNKSRTKKYYVTHLLLNTHVYTFYESIYQHIINKPATHFKQSVRGYLNPSSNI